jgi:Txe/YoeB family toxin of Txe-Axe toxin-antitoxin module
VTWRLVYTRHARKDARKLAESNLKEKAQSLLKLLEEAPPPFEKLVGDLSGAYSRRINI